MRVLVTGGSGFIGSAVCDELAKAGYEPVIVDKKIQPWFTSGRYSYHEVRVQDYTPEYPIDACIHMAASHVVSDSVKYSTDYYDNNINSLLHIIRLKPKKIVYSSSAAVYGLGSNFTEQSETNPINPYGRSKLWGEQILKDSGVNHLSLRYFNAAGAGDNHGYYQNPKTHAIPILLDCVKTNKIFTVFGNNHKTKDGTCERDYTHVKDIARAHVLALQYSGNHTAMNIGSGQGTTMKELIKSVATTTNRAIQWKIGDKRDYDPPTLVANIDLITKELGWKPEYSLEAIIKDAWLWQQTKY